MKERKKIIEVMEMVSKTDISITLFHKNYFELKNTEKAKVDDIYESHLNLRERAKHMR